MADPGYLRRIPAQKASGFAAFRSGVWPEKASENVQNLAPMVSSVMLEKWPKPGIFWGF